ncbi:PfkB family carbohydrate kinase, partial [Enterobacter cloacae]|uniref:PfkB family carbohydrate kinase n=1 Tax=Enterobacter cloacae TaxID=550 RepID=UPI003D694671
EWHSPARYLPPPGRNRSPARGIADFYLNKGVKAVVLKTGADGAWFKTADGEQGAVAAVKVENVVDTVGAGDGFAVGDPPSAAVPRGRRSRSASG